MTIGREINCFVYPKTKISGDISVLFFLIAYIGRSLITISLAMRTNYRTSSSVMKRDGYN